VIWKLQRSTNYFAWDESLNTFNFDLTTWYCLGSLCYIRNGERIYTILWLRCIAAVVCHCHLLVLHVQFSFIFWFFFWWRLCWSCIFLCILVHIHTENKRIDLFLVSIWSVFLALLTLLTSQWYLPSYNSTQVNLDSKIDGVSSLPDCPSLWWLFYLS
jgi:hypothetical protein